MGNWQKKTIGDVFKISSGGTPSRKKNEYFINGNIPWVKTGELKGKYANKPKEYITAEALKNSSAKIFPVNTVLLAMYGATIGACSILNFEAATNQACAALLPTEECNETFLFYYLSSIKKEIIKKGVGGAQPNISASLIKKLQIPLPPLETQKKIAAILDEADKLRQLNKQLIAKYEQLTQSLFLDMFGDPVTNPKGWEKVKLGSLSNISSGSTPSRKNEEYFNGNIPWVKTGEVKGTYIRDSEEKISDEALKNSSCRLYPKGSLIIAMYGQGKTRGQVGILDIEATTNQACAVIPPSDMMNFIYLLELLRHSYDDLRDLGRGGNQPNLNAGLIKNYGVINPPITLQNQFAEWAQAIEAQKEQAQAALAKSEALFNSLLQKAFAS